jgi:hypothetical protein
VISHIGDKKFDADGNHKRVFIVYDIPYKNSSVSGEKNPEVNVELNTFNDNVKRMQNCISVYNILNPVFMSKILGESTTICLPTWISIETLTHKKTKESLKEYLKYLTSIEKYHNKNIVQQILIRLGSNQYVSNYLFIKKSDKQSKREIVFIFDNENDDPRNNAQQYYIDVLNMYFNNSTKSSKTPPTNGYVIDTYRIESMLQTGLHYKYESIISKLFVLKYISININKPFKNIDDNIQKYIRNYVNDSKLKRPYSLLWYTFMKCVYAAALEYSNEPYVNENISSSNWYKNYYSKKYLFSMNGDNTLTYNIINKTLEIKNLYKKIASAS